MKIIITETQIKFLLEGLSDDSEFREMIKSYESTVVDDEGKHYTFDDKDPKKPKTFIASSKTPRKGTLTIGWGHTGSEAKPGKKISNEKAEELLTKDIESEEQKAIGLFPRFKNYPTYVQRALLNAVYRGEAKKDYQWVKDINSGYWESATKHYLEGWGIDFSNKDIPGTLANRMYNNQKAFQKYVDELKKKMKAKKQTLLTKDQCLALSKKDALKHKECEKYSDKSKVSNLPVKTHIVKSGDSLSELALKYKTTVQKIKSLNNLKSDKIEIGQKLRVQ